MSYTQSFNESMTKDDREDAERRMATVKPVTAGIASKAVIQAQQSGDAIQETQDAIAAAFKAISVSKSQGTVNVNAFNNARIELKNAKDALAVAQSRATPGEQVLMSQLQEQVDTIQGEVDIQLRYLQTSTAQPSMTKDDREDAERRMAYVKPVTAGIASKAVINAQLNMTKDDREDAERRLAYAKSVTATVVQSGMTKDDREDAERRMAYVKPVTAGIASKAVIQAQQSGDAIQETQDAIAAAFKAISVSKSQGTVNVNAFNNARIELKNAKDALAVAQSRATPGEQVLMSQLQEQVDTIQGEVDIQLRYLQTSTAQPSMTKDAREDAERRMATVKPVTAGIASNAVIQAQSNKSKEDLEISNAYKTPGYVQPVYASQVRPQASNTSTSTGMTRMTASPVIIPGTKDAREAAAAAAAAGTDWVKLALQVGMAYLLLA